MSKQKGFTLIEVMVAVMILSVVITALLQLKANNTHLFQTLEKKSLNIDALSLLNGKTYGFEKERVSLNLMLDRFDMDDKLLRELKGNSATLFYQELESIDLSEYDQSDEEDTNATNATMKLMVGKTIMKFHNNSFALLRIRLQ